MGEPTPSRAWLNEQMDEFQKLYEQAQKQGGHGRVVLNQNSVHIALKKLATRIYHDPENPHDPQQPHSHR